MPQNEISAASKRLTILVGLGVVGAMAFGLSVSFYRNLLFEETLENLSVRNKDLRAHIDDGLRELEYYRSLQYRDKYAKENLGRISPGEKVLILTEDTQKAFIEEERPDRLKQRDIAYKKYLQSIPVLDHWRMYLFAAEELESLKRSF